MKKDRLISSPCMHQLFTNAFCLSDLQIPIKLKTLRQEKKPLFISKRAARWRQGQWLSKHKKCIYSCTVIIKTSFPRKTAKEGYEWTYEVQPQELQLPFAPLVLHSFTRVLPLEVQDPQEEP